MQVLATMILKVTLSHVGTEFRNSNQSLSAKENPELETLYHLIFSCHKLCEFFQNTLSFSADEIPRASAKPAILASTSQNPMPYG